MRRLPKSWMLTLVMGGLFMISTEGFAEMITITGKPVIDAPALLEWPYDRGIVMPNLNDPTSNTLYDFHGDLSSCELVFSTEGNYEPALKEIWPIFLSKFKDRPLRNWFYTTSPPVAVPQLTNHVIQVGNLYASCKPHLVVGTRKLIKRLAEIGHAKGAACPLYKDRGSVILVKKGNPKNVLTVWDLGRDDVRVVSPNPEREPGSFGTYAETIYRIAENDACPPPNITADTLIDAVFNRNPGDPHKWLAGPRIHHRDMPWSIAYGKADAGVILYHLGLYITQTFPDKFDIVPLGGTVDDPQPLKGTVIGTRYMVRIKGDLTPRQAEVRETLIKTLLSRDFTDILAKRGMSRPDGFVPMKE